MPVTHAGQLTPGKETDLSPEVSFRNSRSPARTRRPQQGAVDVTRAAVLTGLDCAEPWLPSPVLPGCWVGDLICEASVERDYRALAH